MRSTHRGLHAEYPYTATFDQGFAERTVERETSADSKVKNLGLVAKEFCEAVSNVFNEQAVILGQIGRGYGLLGLEKERLKTLDYSREGRILDSCSSRAH